MLSRVIQCYFIILPIILYKVFAYLIVLTFLLRQIFEESVWKWSKYTQFLKLWTLDICVHKLHTCNIFIYILYMFVISEQISFLWNGACIASCQQSCDKVDKSG